MERTEKDPHGKRVRSGLKRLPERCEGRWNVNQGATQIESTNAPHPPLGKLLVPPKKTRGSLLIVLGRSIKGDLKDGQSETARERGGKLSNRLESEKTSAGEES